MKIDKADLMQQAWQAAEDSSDPRDVFLLTLAGNLVEATFDETPTGDALKLAIENAAEGIEERFGAKRPVEEDRS